MNMRPHWYCQGVLLQVSSGLVLTCGEGQGQGEGQGEGVRAPCTYGGSRTTPVNLEPERLVRVRVRVTVRPGLRLRG